MLLEMVVTTEIALCWSSNSNGLATSWYCIKSFGLYKTSYKADQPISLQESQKPPRHHVHTCPVLVGCVLQLLNPTHNFLLISFWYVFNILVLFTPKSFFHSPIAKFNYLKFVSVISQFKQSSPKWCGQPSHGIRRCVRARWRVLLVVPSESCVCVFSCVCVCTFRKT